MPLRAALLRRAGYEVTEVKSLTTAFKLLESETFDLLLTCQAVPPYFRSVLIETIGPLRPLLRFLCLEPDLVYYSPDYLLPGSSTAPKFLTDVRNAMHGGPPKRVLEMKPISARSGF